MDLTDSIIPKSDQLNSEDMLTGPRTVTISDVRAGSDEQPVEIHLEEFPGRPFKPSKTVRRVLVAAWGKEAGVYVGRRMTIFRDPHVKWAGEEVGGIRVSHLSHIDKPMSVALTVTRGKRAMTTVQPLTDSPAPATPPDPSEPTAAEVAACDDADVLRDMWKSAKPAMRKVIEARVAEIGGAA